MTKIVLSPLPKTWLIDIDGVLFAHNGYLQGEDRLLPGVKAFFEQLGPEDKVILLTARKPQYLEQTQAALANFGIRYDHILFGLPTGERIAINDRKPSGLATCHALNLDRDEGLADIEVVIDPKL